MTSVMKAVNQKYNQYIFHTYKVKNGKPLSDFAENAEKSKFVMFIFIRKYSPGCQ
jgi:hypothetical protein